MPTVVESLKRVEGDFEPPEPAVGVGDVQQMRLDALALLNGE